MNLSTRLPPRAQRINTLVSPLQKHACVQNAHATLAGEQNRLQHHRWTRVGQQGKAVCFSIAAIIQISICQQQHYSNGSANAFRRRRCSPSRGNTPLGTAGRWIKTPVCSSSGPFTQVSGRRCTYRDGSQVRAAGALTLLLVFFR